MKKLFHRRLKSENMPVAGYAIELMAHIGGSLCNNAEKWLETSSSTTETWILLAPDCYLKHLARVCGILN